LNNKFIVYKHSKTEIKLANGATIDYILSNETVFEEIIKSNGVIKQELTIEVLCAFVCVALSSKIEFTNYCVCKFFNTENHGDYELNIIYASYYIPVSQSLAKTTENTFDLENTMNYKSDVQKASVRNYGRLPGDLFSASHNQILSANGIQSANAQCSKECNGQRPVRSVCIDEKVNVVVDQSLCSPDRLRVVYEPCNEHCKFV
jgi:hypothetical protein